jgi:hypothetical protein
MAYELTGTIKKIFDRQDFPSGFYKQEFVVTTQDRYPQEIKLNCLKEKADLLNAFSEGAAVKVTFDIQGREWNERYFVDLNAWKIEAGEGASSAESAPPPAVNAEEPGSYSSTVEDDDDIPF